jgi:hypothetical protein
MLAAIWKASPRTMQQTWHRANRKEKRELRRIQNDHTATSLLERTG